MPPLDQTAGWDNQDAASIYQLLTAPPATATAASAPTLAATGPVRELGDGASTTLPPAELAALQAQVAQQRGASGGGPAVLTAGGAVPVTLPANLPPVELPALPGAPAPAPIDVGGGRPVAVPAAVVAPATQPGEANPDAASIVQLLRSGIKEVPRTAEQQKEFPVAPGQTTGMGPNIAAGVASGVAAGPDIASDPFGNLIGRPLATAIVAAHDALAPVFGYDKFPDHVRGMLLGDIVPQPGDVLVSKAAHALGLPAPEDVVPSTAEQSMARKAATMGTAAVLLGGPKAAIPGVVGGGVGDVVSRAVPPEYQPIAELAGNVVGAGVTAPVQALGVGGTRLVANAGRSVAGTVRPGTPEPVINPDTGQPFLHPSSTPENPIPVMASPGQGAAVGRMMAKAAKQTPEQLAASLPGEPGVPGSQLTMGQETGNLGLLNRERVLRNQPQGRELFTAQEAKNELARVAALSDSTSADASGAASRWFRSKLRAMQAEKEARTSETQAAADAALESSGVRNAMPATDAVGAAQRTALENLREPEKAAASAALDALDPEGKLALDVTSIGDEATRILKDEVGEADVLPAAAQKVLNVASGYKGVIPFSRLRGLLSSTSDAMRMIVRNPELGRESKPYRLMSMMMGSIQDTLSEAAGRAAGEDVANGVPAGSRTVDRFDQVQRQQDGQPPIGGAAGPVVAGNAATGAAARGVGEGGAAPAGAEPTGGPGAPTGAGGVAPGAATTGAGLAAEAAAWQRARGSAETAPAPPAENFSPEARAQLGSANRQYALYKDRFRTGAVGNVLRQGNVVGTFKLGDVQVPGQLWRPGAAGSVAADSLIKAAGSPEAAQAIIQDAAALSLRDAAVKDGVINPAAASRWQKAYAPVLAKFPELAAKFANAADAQRAVQDAATRAQERLNDYQDSAAKYYLGKTDEGASPHVAIQRLMGSENSEAAATDLMRQAAGNQAAIDGIRRNTVEWLMSRTRSTAEAGTTGEAGIANASYQRLINDPKVRPALKAILTPDQMRVADAVGKDMQKAARAWQAVKIPGSPGTAADLHALGEGNGPSQLIQMWLGEKLGGAAGHVLLPGAGPVVRLALEAAGFYAGFIAKARRTAGLASLDDLFTAGVLDPRGLGKVLLQQAVTDTKSPRIKDTARQIVALGSAAATTTPYR